MRYLILTYAIIILAVGSLHADALQISVTPATAQVRGSAPVAMSVTLKNTLIPREPFIITAQAEWEDERGQTQTTTASTTINIVQPVKVNRYKVAIPALFGFVAGSAKLNGQPVTPTLDSGQLVFDVAQTLFEGESAILEYSLKAQ